jgi:hypothetical protein
LSGERVYQALGKARTKRPAPPPIQLPSLLLAPIAVCTTFADAKPSAITAINTTARSFFMDFSPLKNQIWFLSADTNAVSMKTEGKSMEQISRCEAGGF